MKKTLDRLIDKDELIALVPYSLSHIGRLEKAGKFPRRIRIGESRVAWSLNEITDWINLKKNQESNTHTARTIADTKEYSKENNND